MNDNVISFRKGEPAPAGQPQAPYVPTFYGQEQYDRDNTECGPVQGIITITVSTKGGCNYIVDGLTPQDTILLLERFKLMILLNPEGFADDPA
jgi:hypothetical protein